MGCEYTGYKLHTHWGSYAETYGNCGASGSSNYSLVCFGSVTLSLYPLALISILVTLSQGFCYF